MRKKIKVTHRNDRKLCEVCKGRLKKLKNRYLYLDTYQKINLLSDI